MKNFLKFLLLVFVASTILVACSKEEETTLSPVEKDEYFVDLAEATQIANHVGQYLKTDAGQRADNADLVNNHKQIADRAGKTSLYVFNYERGGFLLLAADKRYQPLLAMSPTNDFAYDRENMHSGLLEWLDEMKENVHSLRNDGASQTVEMRQQWEHIGDVSRRPFPIDDEGPGGGGGCEEWFIQRGPLLATSWNQWCTGFNDLAPTCSNWCGRVPIGCVATAMAQVIRYHEHPSTYNYGTMNNSSGGGDTPQLYFDAAESVDMDYGCDGSGAQTADVDNALRDDFDYSSASYSNFNHTTVKNEIRYNRPVILRGRNSDGGHAWVTDGYKNWMVCFEGGGAVTYLQLHMNWGWGGTHDGWYWYNNWNPGSTTYNSSRKMVHNIRP